MTISFFYSIFFICNEILESIDFASSKIDFFTEWD